MNGLGGRLECSGCGAVPAAGDPYPFRCPDAGLGDVDHVLVRRLDLRAARWPEEDRVNPFLRYRTLLRSHQLVLEGGLGDAAYRDLVSALDSEIAAVDGRGFTVTPFARSGELSDALGFKAGGGVWVKDETGNVGGSHKGRHLMGVALHLEVADRLGLTRGRERPRLAIASCGNAALAAAVVARAAGRALEVFAPEDADPGVLARLRALGATVEVCPRRPGEPGDPAYNRLSSALEAGVLPFTCQGNLNGLAIEGGETLGWEIVDSLRETGDRLDRVIVQVGGGALASAVAKSFQEAVALSALPAVPRIDTVQTKSAFPLKRAADRLAGLVAAGWTAPAALAYAARHRSEFMWPWEDTPRSVAHGILDDETYDWLAVVSAMVAGGGRAVAVDEDLLREANEVGRSMTGIDADHTGTAGLAGLMAMIGEGSVDPGERVAVIVTGARR